MKKKNPITVCQLFVSIIFLSPSPALPALCLFQITQMSR